MAKTVFLSSAGTLTGMGMGACLMYLADPNLGKRRRALVRDKITKWSRRLGGTINATACDVSNRVIGITAEMQALFQGDKTDSPDRLQARIRSKMGRYLSHPSALHVEVCDAGRVILQGPILQAEVDDLLSVVAAVRGVKIIENHLDVHRTPEDIPELQGSIERQSRPTQWPPATRLLAGSAGTFLMLNAVRNLGVVNCLLGMVGFGLFMRAATNEDFGRMVGVSGTYLIETPAEPQPVPRPREMAMQR